MFHVYVVKHEASGRTFVGVTKDPAQRWRAHRAAKGSGRRPIDQAIKREGSGAFTFTPVAAFSTRAEALAEHTRRIRRLRSDDPNRGYNKRERPQRRESRDEELARLIAEQRDDAKQDMTGLRSTMAQEFWDA